MDHLPLQIHYCLTCGETDITYTDKHLGMRYHVVDNFLEDEACQPEQCFGPFASCPPPITDDAYWDWLFSQPEPDEPDPIELLIVDLIEA